MTTSPADSKDYELNEVDWWSKWVDETVWVSKNSYAIFSDAFKDESFFNRGGFLGVERVPADAVAALEEQFEKRRRTPCILVEGGHPWDKLRSSLSPRGYLAGDRMLVMESKSKPKSELNPEVEVVMVGSKTKGGELQEWTRTYLQAFYGHQRLSRKVNEVVRKAVKDKKASFILARVSHASAGCSALYRTTGGVVGAYCIGTHPDFRDRGVAATLVGFMRQLAEKEGRTLILQTMASDSLEGFYAKLGFKVAYSKAVYEKRPKKGPAGNDLPSGETFGVRMNRRADPGKNKPFSHVFSGFEEVDAVKRIFGPDTGMVISKLEITLESPPGYLRVDGETGHVIINPEYLRTGHERHLYLDVIHELVHVRQFHEGKELYDRRYPYFERPTEVEAYKAAVEEARRIGMGREEIVEYLRVEWVTEKEFAKFVSMMGLDEV